MPRWPDVADGQAYSVADDDQFSIRQWAEKVAGLLGAELEFVGIPSIMAPSALVELYPPSGRPHMLLDANKAKNELGYRQVVSAYDAMREARQQPQHRQLAVASQVGMLASVT